MSGLSLARGGYSPAGLAEYIEALPFLGTFSSSHSRLTAGSFEELIFDYTVGGAALADGGWFKITFKFYSDWAPFQTVDAAAANYLSVEYLPRNPFSGESEATVRELKVRYDQKGHERPYQKAIIVDVVDGYLKPGDVIRIRAGDRRQGGAGTRVQTFAEDSFRFRAYVDTAGTSRFAAVPGDAVLEIAPGSIDRLVLATPRLVRTKHPFALNLRAGDCWGNVVAGLSGIVQVGVVHPDGARKDIELTWPSTGPSVLREEFSFEKEGPYFFEAKAGKWSASTFVNLEDGLSVPQAWFADLHVHSHDTVGTNSTRGNFTFARDAAALDVLGYTVNDFQIREDAWRESISLVHEFHQDDRFVVFAGTEWCGSSAAGGDHNVIFLGDDIRFPLDSSGHSLRSFDWNEHTTAKTQVPGRWPLSRLYEAYEDEPEKFLLIPHVGGRRALLEWHHPELDRLIEITSSWGHFHWFYQDAISRGWKLGASAAGDEHRGRPGGGSPGVSVFGVPGGLTGIVSEKLNRDSIGKALRARHTWATTGERNVAILSSGIHGQGDAFEHHGPAQVSWRLLGQAGWEYAALYDHRGVLRERNLHAELGFSPRRIRIRWGGARIRDRYRWAIWKGTLTVGYSAIALIRTDGLEHPEETVGQVSANRIEFATETYGDSDAFTIDVSDLAKARFRLEVEIDGFNKTGDPMERNPWTPCPKVNVEFTGEDLIRDVGIHQRLPGQELFIEATRITAKPLPVELSGTWDVDPQNAAFNFRPVYLFGREVTQAKVWTSPLFIHFV